MQMDIAGYSLPELKDYEIVFSTLDVPESLLHEARKRSMDQPTNLFHRLASFQFANREEGLTLRSDIDEGFGITAVRYIDGLLRSFVPKHEDKIAVVALILSEIIDINSLPGKI